MSYVYLIGAIISEVRGAHTLCSNFLEFRSEGWCVCYLCKYLVTNHTCRIVKPNEAIT